MNRPQAVLFDLDGTLVDSLDALADAANHTASHFGLPTAPRELVRKRIGHGARALVEKTVGNDAPLEAAVKVFYDRYREVMGASVPFPGMMDILRALGERGVVRGCATNKPAAFTAPILEDSGLSAHLEAWASGDEVARKPDPGVLALVLERAGAPGIDPREVIYVGDMPVDAETARNFGCPIIGVGWGLDPDGLMTQRPDHWVEDPGDLARVLDL